MGAPLPHPLLDRPDGREIGVVERIWRQPAPEGSGWVFGLVLVWAEGTLNAGERLPYPYGRRVIWLEELAATVEGPSYLLTTPMWPNGWPGGQTI